MQTTRSNSPCLIVGDTGTGKTSLIATYADWVYRKFGKSTLYYLADGGGYGSQIEALVEKGIIWVWKMRTRGESFETCSRASQGYWPESWDPKTGDSDPSCKLLAPISAQFTLNCMCAKGKITKPIKGALISQRVPCPECKVPINAASPGTTITEEIMRTPGFESIGGVAFDGVSSMQSWILEDLAIRTASGQLEGEKTGLGGKIISGETSFGGNNRAHYGFAQSRGERWLLDSAAIPFLVAPPIWTALEEKSTDKETKITAYGPKLAGSAKTTECPQWVGNCLGTQIIQDEKGRNVYRLNLQEWRDPLDNVPHLCKNRALPGILPPYLEDGYDADGNIIHFKNFNVGTFFDLLDSALDKAMKEADKKYPNAPGIPTGKLGVKPDITKIGVKPGVTK